MRIILDLQVSQTSSRFEDIGRYSLALAKEIAGSRSGHEVIIALNGLFPDTIEPIRAAFDGVISQQNIRVWSAAGPLSGNDFRHEWRRKAAERMREAFLLRLNPDIVHLMNIFEGYADNAVTTIGVFSPRIPTTAGFHEIITSSRFTRQFNYDRQYKNYFIEKIDYLKRADKVITVSEAAAGDITDTLGLARGSVACLSANCSPAFRPMNIGTVLKSRLFQRFRIRKHFIMLDAGEGDDREILCFLRAYCKLPPAVRSEHQILLAGHICDDKRSKIYALAASSGLREGELMITHQLNDEDSACLYNLSRLLAVLSPRNTLCLTAMEAVNCGAPVIGAGSKYLKETLGYDGALFEPNDEDSIKSRLYSALLDESFTRDVILNEIKHRKEGSIEQNAGDIIGLFEKTGKPPVMTPEYADNERIVEDLLESIGEAENGGKVQSSDLIAAAHCIGLNHAALPRKQLFVDISEFVNNDIKTGVQRVTRSVLKELLEFPPEGFSVEPVFATSGSKGYFYARQFLDKMQGRPRHRKDSVIDFQPGDVFLGLHLQHLITKAQADYLSLMHRNGVGIYFVVYDLLPILFPHYWPAQHGVDKIHHEWLQIISRFDGAVCISQAVADEFSCWQKVHCRDRLRPFKMGWFHLGADVDNSIPTKGMPDNAPGVLAKLAARQTFLMVGTIEPRKGYSQALDAFDLLWRAGVDVNLVIVGKNGWMVQGLTERLRRHQERDKRLFWLEGISDEFLEKIYLNSACLIAASEGEGFGLPLIEAAQHNLPIIARDIPVFREVAGEYAFYFGGGAPEILADAVKKWLALNARGCSPASISMPWLTWHRSTQQLLEAIIPQPEAPSRKSKTDKSSRENRDRGDTNQG